MIIPLVFIVVAYLVGKFVGEDRKKGLERQLNISEGLRATEKKKTRDELIEELRKE